VIRAQHAAVPPCLAESLCLSGPRQSISGFLGEAPPRRLRRSLNLGTPSTAEPGKAEPCRKSGGRAAGGTSLSVFLRTPWLLAGLVMLLLAGVSALGARAEVLDRVVASIGEVAITQSDVEREYRLERFLDGQWPPSAPDPKALDMARERLTYQKLLLEEETQDLSRDPALEKTATEELAGVRQRFPSEKDFQAALGALHMDEKQVLTTLVEQQRILRVIEERLRSEAAPATPQVETYYRDVFTPEYTRTRGLPVPPLTEVLGQIQEILVQQKINQLLADWLAELRPSRRVRFYGAVTSDK